MPTIMPLGARGAARHRPLLGALALGLLALPGCVSMAEALRRAEERRLVEFVQGGAPMVLLGIQRGERPTPAIARLRRFGAAEEGWPPPRGDALASASFEANDRRWFVMRAEPGRYRLSIGMAHVLVEGQRFAEIEAPLGWQTFTVEVPPAAGVTYVGTVNIACDAGSRRFATDAECRIDPRLSQEPEVARAVALQRLGTAGEFAAAPALAALPAPADLRVRPPRGAVEASAETGRWRTDIEWREFTGDEQSRRSFRSAGRMMDAASSSGTSDLAAIIAVPIVAAAAVTGVVGLAQAGVEANEQARAQRELGECASRISHALAAEPVLRRAQAALAERSWDEPRLASRGRAAAQQPPAADWRISVTRVALRRCGAEQHYGIDVATRWTAWPPGAAEPAYDATVVTRVADPVEDSRLQSLRPRSAEVVLPQTLSCRRFADYCAPDGVALLDRDIGDAIRAARDAVSMGQ